MAAIAYPGCPGCSATEYWNFIVFHYQPSMQWPWVWVAAFLLTFTGSFAVTMRYTPRHLFPWLVPIACAMEVVGWGTRVGTVEFQTIPWIVVSDLCLLGAPILLAAALYSATSQVLGVTGHSALGLRPHNVSRVFVSADVSTLLIQCAAAGLLSSHDPDTQRTGRIIILVGLVMQLILFAAFTVLLWQLQWVRPRYAAVDGIPTRRLFFVAAWAITVCMWFRNVYRVLEYAFSFGSNDSQPYLLYHEWLLILFDATMMWFASVTFCVLPFGKLLAGLQRAPEVPSTEADKDATAAGAVAAADNAQPRQQPQAIPGAHVAAAVTFKGSAASNAVGTRRANDGATAPSGGFVEMETDTALVSA